MTHWEPITIPGLIDKETGQQFYLTRIDSSGFDAYISPGAASGGRWWGDEMPLQKFILKTLEPGKRFADVGANHGRYSLMAIHKGAQVVAFEPEARNFEMLERNLQNTGEENAGLWEAHQVAIDHELDSVELKWSRDACCTSIHRSGDPLRIETVACKPLREFGRFDLIKIDTEGNEMRALKSSDPDAVFIVEPHDCGDAMPEPILEWARAHGKTGYYIDGDGNLFPIEQVLGLRHIVLI